MQQNRAPRPLPLFLELVREVAQTEPALAAKAIEGLKKYEEVERPAPRKPHPVFARCGAATIRDYGGSGPPLILVPSLINPPSILDLDDEVSLARELKRMGRRVLLVDWGSAADRRGLGIGGHVRDALVEAFRSTGEPPAVIGYCLGGTMAIAAANFAPVERLATLATPWNFNGYPADSRTSLQQLWSASNASAAQLGLLPMEVLQSAFWSLDPKRTVAKFARFADLPAGSAQARRFVTLEDWANEGEALPLPAARELIEDLFGSDLSGKGEWMVGGRAVSDRLDCPQLNITSASDRITPAATAPAGEAARIESGHVGMVVGSARTRLYSLLNDFLAGLAPRR